MQERPQIHAKLAFSAEADTQIGNQHFYHLLAQRKLAVIGNQEALG